jgi:hypothetical protein
MRYLTGGPDESNSHATDNSYDLGSALHSIEHAAAAAAILAQHHHHHHQQQYEGAAVDDEAAEQGLLAIPSEWAKIIHAIPGAFSFDATGAPGGRRMLRCWGGGVNNTGCNGIGEKTAFFAIYIFINILFYKFIKKNADFTKTGSGQT